MALRDLRRPRRCCLERRCGRLRAGREALVGVDGRCGARGSAASVAAAMATHGTPTCRAGALRWLAAADLFMAGCSTQEM